MPRYYFRLTDGNETLSSKGLELPGNAAAREEALVLARKLRKGEVMPVRDWGGWFIEIVDKHGHRVDTIPVSDAPEEPSLGE